MTQDFSPITPPPEIKAKWMAEGRRQDYCSTTDYAITQAAQWGYEQCGAVNGAELQKARDEELEACCEWLKGTAHIGIDFELINARRPKLPSLKDEARQIIDCLIEGDCLNDDDAVTLRRALEALPD